LMRSFFTHFLGDTPQCSVALLSAPLRDTTLLRNTRFPPASDPSFILLCPIFPCFLFTLDISFFSFFPCLIPHSHSLLFFPLPSRFFLVFFLCLPLSRRPASPPGFTDTRPIVLAWPGTFPPVGVFTSFGKMHAPKAFCSRAVASDFFVLPFFFSGFFCFCWWMPVSFRFTSWRVFPPCP